MPKTTKKLTEEKKAKVAALQNMFREKIYKSSFKDKIDELIKLLTPFGENGVPIDEAAKMIGLDEQGLRDIKTTTHTDELEIFPPQKGKRQIPYIKIKKKQP